MRKILVTGGAGFVGSYTVDNLVENGYEVRVLDNLEPQVHKNVPPYLNENAEFIKGDVTNPGDWKKALDGVDAVVHLAAMVGVGQSMYQPARYANTNVIGTSLLYETVMGMKRRPEKIIVAGSKASYGEGAYSCEEHEEVYPELRSTEQLMKRDWEQRCPACGTHVKPVPTKESKPQQNPNVYALTKYDQEKLALSLGSALGIPTVVFRYFNVYGPRQSLNNPYTGVTAIFSSRIKNNNPPVIYEDGKQIRDFIYVEDVARANVAALESDKEGVFNVGSGEPISIFNIASTLAKLYGSDVEPAITHEFRKGDTRHDYADISLIEKEIGWKPKTDIKTGFKKLVEWGFSEEAEDRFDIALKEMKEHGLIS